MAWEGRVRGDRQMGRNTQKANGRERQGHRLKRGEENKKSKQRVREWKPNWGSCNTLTKTQILNY